MATKINDNLYSWASVIDPGAIAQAERTARLPILAGHVALMADAHVGFGATVGSVVPTRGAIIPSCVGVDIGCGMAAVKTSLDASDLPDSLDGLLPEIARAVPAGVGQGNQYAPAVASTWIKNNPIPSAVSDRLHVKSLAQLGSLGSGNHFAEVSLSTTDEVWVVLHSGSRGIGNQLAQSHINVARKSAAALATKLEDRDLAWLSEGTPEFEAYVADLLWAQKYARTNRDIMLDRLLREVFDYVGAGRELERVNCHHNYAALETWDDERIWVTRKGAISAREGELGVIPGSMGTDTFIVEGLGNPLSFASSSHGAGRVMSRTAAKKNLTPDSLAEAMEGRAWLSGRAKALVDEHPAAYKDIHQVMSDQADLVRVNEQLHAVLNYKGV